MQIDDIKILLDIKGTAKDDLLSVLIHTAEEEVRDYTHSSDAVEALESTINQMVIYKYNRLRTEGVGSESYSGVSFNYLDDYPESIIRSLRSKRKIRTPQ